jgi:hypothetical protein
MQHLPTCRSSCETGFKLDVLAALCKVRRLQMRVNALGDFARVTQQLRANKDATAAR